MLEQLYKEAEELAGRPVEVDRTADHKFIVLYMVFEQSPPPKADTEEGALKAFIDWIKGRKVEPTENTL